jgi:hypothetical protein
MNGGRMRILQLTIGCLISVGVAVIGVSCSHEGPTGVKHPKTIRVAADRSGDQPTIEAALKIAENGDVIELRDGVFTGPGNEDLDFLGKRVTLRSQSGNPATCVIQLERYYLGRRAFLFQSGEDSGTVVRGIEVVGGTGGYHPQSDHWRVGGRTLSSATYGGAVICCKGASPMLIDCIFAHNAAAEGGVAYCIDKASPTFVGCTFYDNYGGDALFAGFDAIIHFERSLVAFNSGTVLEDYPESASATFRCSDIYGNYSDWGGAIAEMLGLNGNISRDPLFVDAAGGDLSLSPGSPCLPDSTGCGHIGAAGAQ